MLNHVYWHTVQALQVQVPHPFLLLLYFASMVRYSSIHKGIKPYSWEFCLSAFTSTCELKRHRRLHAGEETYQGLQLGFVSRIKRTWRPSKSYMCTIVFYTRGQLSFPKKFNEELKVTINGYTNYIIKSKYAKLTVMTRTISLSLSHKDVILTGIMYKMLVSEADFEQVKQWGNVL